MSDLTIYEDAGNSLHVRVIRHGEPTVEHRLVLRQGETEIVSAPLFNGQIGMLAAILSGAYFDKTRRLIWPIGGSMLHLYEKEQLAAEEKHLAWLKNHPSEETRACAADYEARITRAAGAELKQRRADLDQATADEIVDISTLDTNEGDTDKVRESDHAPRPPRRKVL